MLANWTTTLASGAALCYSTMAASEMNSSSLAPDLADNGLTSVDNAASSPPLVPQEPLVKDEKVVPVSSSQPRGQGRERGKRGLRVLFLSSDTGGGHRASAESLASQFELLYPGSTYELLDVASEAYLPPYNSIVSYYKHLSAHPTQWKILYGFSNSKAMERVVDTNIKFMSLMCERSMRKKLKSYEADVVVSVHPLMTSIPNLSCTKISHETGKHLPMFTVVTDLGSAHSTWFAPGVEKLFVGSQQIYDLARQRKVPEEKLVLVGLPIRHDFALQAEKFGDRMSPEGKDYQRQVRRDLELPFVDRKTLLVMGGGEGVGSLSSIVDALYVELVRQGIDAIILVVCGRNDKLKLSLEERDWASVFEQRRSNRKGFVPTMSSAYFSDLGGCVEATSAAGCIEGGLVTQSLRRILSSGRLMPSESAVFIPSPTNVGEEQKHRENGKELRRNSNSIGAIEYREDHGKSLGSVESSPSDEDRNAVSSPTVEDAIDDDDLVATADNLPVNLGDSSNDVSEKSGKVTVLGLGFVTRMAEYMVAADILVSKAGPGTISEAAAVSLPVMLTSFLPGQEEGNVDYVVDGGFGAYCHDSDPEVVAEEVADWLKDEEKLAKMSAAAKLKGAPYAARDIVRQIGDSTLHWIDLNENHASEDSGVPQQEENEGKNAEA